MNLFRRIFQRTNSQDSQQSVEKLVNNTIMAAQEEAPFEDTSPTENEYLLLSIKDYLNQPSTDYGVFVSGDWGIGKTYFLKHRIIPLIKRTNLPKKPDDLYKEVYYSVYGLSSIEELRMDLSIEMMPKIWRNAAKLGKIANRVFDRIDEDGLKELPTAAQWWKNRVLIIDDLERLDPSLLQNVLGYVNKLIEHKKVKVLFVANEKEIISQARTLNEEGETITDYERKKEKAIRYTLTFEPEIENAYDPILKSLNIEDNENFTQEVKTTILSAFKKAGYANLRTLTFVLDVLRKIFNSLDPENTDLSNKFQHWNRINNELTTYVSSVAIFYHKYSSDPNFIKRLEPLNIESLDIAKFVTNKEEDQIHLETESPVDEFRSVFVNDDFVYFSSVNDLLVSGAPNQELITNEISNKSDSYQRQQEQTEKIEKVNRLVRYSLLEQSEIEPAIDEVLEIVQAGGFDLAFYAQLLGTFLQLKYRDIYDKNIAELCELIKTASGVGNDGMKYNFSLDMQIHIENYLPLDIRTKISEEDRNEYQQLSDHLIDLNRTFASGSDYEASIEILNQLNAENIDTFVECALNSKTMFLRHANPENFWHFYLNGPNKVAYKISQVLIPRMTRNVVSHAEEGRFYQDLRELIDAEIGNIPLEETNRKQTTEVLLSNLKQCFPPPANEENVDDGPVE